MKINIKTIKGDYADHPYRKQVYIKDQLVWEADYVRDYDDEDTLKDFKEDITM